MFEKLSLKSWRENQHDADAPEWEEFHIEGIQRINFNSLKSFLSPYLIAIDPLKVFVVDIEDHQKMQGRLTPAGIIYDLQRNAVIQKVEKIGESRPWQNCVGD